MNTAQRIIHFQTMAADAARTARAYMHSSDLVERKWAELLQYRSRRYYAQARVMMGLE